jgi:hypothetical protein
VEDANEYPGGEGEGEVSKYGEDGCEEEDEPEYEYWYVCVYQKRKGTEIANTLRGVRRCRSKKKQSNKNKKKKKPPTPS